jgi:hypothetical protein
LVKASSLSVAFPLEAITHRYPAAESQQLLQQAAEADPVTRVLSMAAVELLEIAVALVVVEAHRFTQKLQEQEMPGHLHLLKGSTVVRRNLMHIQVRINQVAVAVVQRQQALPEPLREREMVAQALPRQFLTGQLVTTVVAVVEESVQVDRL